MKNFKIFIIMIMVILITFTGCSDSDTKTDAPLSSEGQENSSNKELVNSAESNKEETDNEESEEEKITENDNAEKNENEKGTENNTPKGDESKEHEDNGSDVETLNPESGNNDPDKDRPDEPVESINNTEPNLENNKNDIENSNSSSNQTDDAAEPAEDTLKIEGSVENESFFTLDDLKAMEEYIFEDDFYSLNSFGTTGYTRFKGVNLWSLLEKEAAISSDAARVTVIAQDGYSMEFTVDQVKKQDYIDETNPDKKYPMIIAWEENEEEYDSGEGAPFKLVVGQKEAGDVNKPQWVSNIDKIVIE